MDTCKRYGAPASAFGAYARGSSLGVGRGRWEGWVERLGDGGCRVGSEGLENEVLEGFKCPEAGSASVNCY